jgi:hypothetical protein
MLIYKIHPAIGVGRGPEKFFVGPETPGHPGVEIHDDSTTETSLTEGKYKDTGRIKRQAVRFRFFAYDQDAAGVQALKREITVADATITWKVVLVNRKVALNHAPSHNGIDPRVAAQSRNSTILGAARAGLVIHDRRDQTIWGKNQSGVTFDQGEFLGKRVLPRGITYRQGRAYPGPGRSGVSTSIAGKATTNFANNDNWHDDMAYGWWYVSALPEGRAVAASFTDSDLHNLRPVAAESLWNNRLGASRLAKERLSDARRVPLAGPSLPAEAFGRTHTAAPVRCVQTK